jgi:hypothetical protein
MGVLFEQKKIKSWSKQHSAENKTDSRKNVLNMQQISLLPKYVKLISTALVLHVQTQIV